MAASWLGSRTPERGRAPISRVTDGQGTGVLDVAQYHETLAPMARTAHAGEFLLWLPLQGAHHRPLTDQPDLDGDRCAWATGDFAHHGGQQTSIGLAEFGGCVDVGEVRMGLGVGTSHSWQVLPFGGSSTLHGQYVVGEIDWKPDDVPLLFSLTGMAGAWGVDSRRAYSNGVATNVSVGETEARGASLRARVEWLDALMFGATRISPYASVGLSTFAVDGFTETGGAFPATFSAQSNAARDVRLGLTAVTEIAETTVLSTTVEVAHRSGDAPGASGQVLGLFDFGFGGGTMSQTWVRAGAEIDQRIADNATISASVNLASAGRDATISGSFGVHAVF